MLADGNNPPTALVAAAATAFVAATIDAYSTLPTHQASPANSYDPRTWWFVRLLCPIPVDRTTLPVGTLNTCFARADRIFFSVSALITF